jgi:hypothetical protein
MLYFWVNCHLEDPRPKNNHYRLSFKQTNFAYPDSSSYSVYRAYLHSLTFDLIDIIYVL